tara:strand:- start:881 stop:1069 length:189 start_codon:yes stop_codon:yes gene_type:complete
LRLIYECVECKSRLVQQKVLMWWDLNEDCVSDGSDFLDEYWCVNCGFGIQVDIIEQEEEERV